MGCGELALADIPAGTGSRAFVQQIINSAEKARILVKQLTGLGYRNVTNLKRMDLDELLSTQVPLLRHVVGDSIQMQFSAVGEGKVIYGATEQLKQMLLDLAENARDAMPSGGNIVVTTRKVRMADEEADQGTREYIQLTFKDSGHGIPEKYLERVFDPFFSYNKGPDAVGLGLSTVSAIVEGHGGFIEVHSKRREGTTFGIYFPATPELSQDKGTGGEVERPPAQGGSETVLIADDDEDVRNIAVKTLQGAGYNVLVAWGNQDMKQGNTWYVAPDHFPDHVGKNVYVTKNSGYWKTFDLDAHRMDHDSHVFVISPDDVVLWSGETSAFSPAVLDRFMKQYTQPYYNRVSPEDWKAMAEEDDKLSRFMSLEDL
jgi:hypothetical protein